MNPLIGTQPTGRLPGIVITAVAHEGLRVSIDGKPGRLAIVDDEGHVLAAGEQVADEATAVAVNCYRNHLRAEGRLTVRSAPIEPTEPKP